VQKKVIVSKEEIIQDYKDIPELSKLKSSLKDEITKLQTDKKIEELKKKFDLDKQKSIEAFSNEAYELYNVLIKLIFVYADYWYFEKVIEKMANIKSKESLLEQLKKRKKIYEEGKDYPRTKIVREVILMRLHAEGKLEL
jgi:Ser-tRNA(Ala) deacylase AlaX